MSETIDKILDAAEGAMRLKGYHAVSFRDLADDLGIKSASVHYHFRQKEDLGRALVERYADRFFTALNDNPEADRLIAYCAAYRDALVRSDRICLCGMLGAESCGLPDSVSAPVRAFFQRNLEWLTKACGSPQRAAHVLAAMQGAMMIAQSIGDYALFDSVVAELTA
ncbi:MAG: TetR/AcrR family transcriptional regulator [Pikeienuella sp.]